MKVFKQFSNGAAAVAMTAAPNRAFDYDYALDSVGIHLSAAGAAGNLTVTLDAAAGSAYDVVLLTQDMTTITDLFWQPDRPVELAEDDKIVVAWANASTRTFGLTVRWFGR